MPCDLSPAEWKRAQPPPKKKGRQPVRVTAWRVQFYCHHPNRGIPVRMLTLLMMTIPTMTGREVCLRESNLCCEPCEHMPKPAFIPRNVRKSIAKPTNARQLKSTEIRVIRVIRGAFVLN